MRNVTTNAENWGNSVIEQPFKIPFVATIVRVANVANEELGKATIEHFGAELQRYWKGGAFTQFKLVLRFFACLGDMVGADGIYPMLEQLWTKLEVYNTEGNEVNTFYRQRRE